MIWAAAYLQSIAGLILLAAGVAKFRDRDALARVIRNYRLLPGGAERPLARALPEIEIALGLALLAGVWRAWAGAAAAALFTLFALGIAINLMKGRRAISCGCFGPDDHSPISEWHVVRNIALAIAPLVASRALIDAYGVLSPPYSILVGPDQHVQAKGVANHFEHLESLLNAARIGHPTLDSYMAATRKASTQVPTGAVN